MNNELMHELTAQPWAIMPHILQHLYGAARTSVQQMVSPDARRDPEAALAYEAAMQQRRATQQAGAIAVIPIAGVIHPKRSALEDVFGVSFGTSLDMLVGQMRAAVDDPGIKAIVLDVNSPGGSAFGLTEAASELAKMRGQKRTIAVSNHLNASAAYWLSAVAADEIVASPSSMTGSVGVVAMHQDVSAAAEMAGIKTTFISAGRYKAEGSPFEPLSDEAKAHAQKMVDEMYGQFVGAVATGRGISAATVRDNYGEGRVLTARDAKAAGMVDRIGTLRDTLVRLGGAAEGGVRAETEITVEAAAAMIVAVEDADRDLRSRRHRLLTR